MFDESMYIKYIEAYGTSFLYLVSKKLNVKLLFMCIILTIMYFE